MLGAEVVKKKTLAPEQVKGIRASLGLNQEELAYALGQCVGTIRAWEQGRRRPNGSAAKLLRYFRKFPERVHCFTEAV